MDVKPQGSRPDQAGSPEQVRSESPDRISHSHLLVSCQETVDDDERTIIKATSTASSELRGQDLFPAEPFMTLQLRSEHACCGACTLGVTPPSTASFSQRYLRTLPSAGSVTLPQCQAVRAAVCGFSGGCPCPAVMGEHVQNSAAVESGTKYQLWMNGCLFHLQPIF